MYSRFLKSSKSTSNSPPKSTSPLFQSTTFSILLPPLPFPFITRKSPWIPKTLFLLPNSLFYLKTLKRALWQKRVWSLFCLFKASYQMLIFLDTWCCYSIFCLQFSHLLSKIMTQWNYGAGQSGMTFHVQNRWFPLKKMEKRLEGEEANVIATCIVLFLSGGKCLLRHILIFYRNSIISNCSCCINSQDETVTFFIRTWKFYFFEKLFFC